MPYFQKTNGRRGDMETTQIEFTEIETTIFVMKTVMGFTPD